MSTCQVFNGSMPRADSRKKRTSWNKADQVAFDQLIKDFSRVVRCARTKSTPRADTHPRRQAWPDDDKEVFRDFSTSTNSTVRSNTKPRSQTSPDADQEVLKHLIKDLSNQQIYKRYQAAERLATYGARAGLAVADLEKTLLDDESALVRKSAALALGSLGTPAALHTLAHAKDNDEDPYVRERAGQAMEELLASCRESFGTTSV